CVGGRRHVDLDYW
nr:immunoglobulin heavy chain junction region [Macaca mulatta]MOX58811.1 immunoglobulin heavy chain junction region [Macaca mulatta]MOX59061.1 immunoglobulin heavy chain junction region [Macaca mulatta]MOX59474.1 immunoglobulin heavy chain junction region [Macaca mulatta]MOX59722.1 immunoglobulin heavy chain junction region [Macaca mulatta]